MVLILTSLGLVPFFVLSVFTSLEMYFGVSFDAMLVAYAGMICSFLAGSQWGIALVNRLSSIWLFTSNLIALMVFWGLYVQNKVSLVLFMVCLVWCLLLDWFLFRRHIIDGDYFRLRCWVSFFALGCLCYRAFCLFVPVVT